MNNLKSVMHLMCLTTLLLLKITKRYEWKIKIMEGEKTKNINLYFEEKRSFLVTEIMSIYTATEDLEIKIKCLELLNKIEG